MNFAVLDRSFYEPSARKVAPRLLGQLLVRRTKAGLIGGVIVETEAYLADDPACHAFPGVTTRNQVMFGPPGRGYVYFIYGCHYCVNAVCGPPGTGEAVLIRALQPTLGEEIMRQHRPVPGRVGLTNGPGKLCAALQITRAENGVDLCDPAGDLFIAENPDSRRTRRQLGPVMASPRIGITKAAHLHLRFCLAKSPFLSRRPGPGSERRRNQTAAK